LVALSLVLSLVIITFAVSRSFVNPCGGAGWWLLWVAPFPIFACAYVFVVRVTLSRFDCKVLAGFPFCPRDVRWTRANAFRFPLYASFAGFCSGCFGLGGGTITAPLMVHLGIQTEVVPATSSFMILYTCILSLTQFIILGFNLWGWALWFFFLGLVSTFIGHHVFRRLIKSEVIRGSVIIACMIGILLLGWVGLVYVGINQVVESNRLGISLGSRPLCDSTGQQRK
jgi:uncharacterized membrane protein YfcA